MAPSGRGRRIDRLFFELGAEVDDFQKGMDNAEKSASKFTSYIKKHPIAAIGALTAAMAALAIGAAKMAAEVETNMRKVGAAMPAAQRQMKQLTDAVIELSKETPRTAAELSSALAEIAKSVKDPDEAMKRLKASVTAADASGIELSATYQGLDAVLDAFTLSGHDSEVVLAKLVATARGKVPLDELFDVLQRNGAELKRMGFGLDEAAIRLVHLMDQGIPAKQVMAQFKDTVKGATGQTIDAARALREMSNAAEFSREGTENLWKVLKNQFSAQMLELGMHILPVVNAELKGMLGLISLLNGTVANIKADAAVTLIENLTKHFDKLDADGKARDLVRLKGALAEIQKATGVQFGASTAPWEIRTKMSDSQIRAYLEALKLIERMEGATGPRSRMVGMLQGEFDRRGLGNVTERQNLTPRPSPAFVDPTTRKQRDELIREAQDALVKMSGSVQAAVNLELTRIAARAHEVFGTEIPKEIDDWMQRLREQFAADDAFAGFTQQFEVLQQKSEEGAEALRGGYAGAIAEATEGLRGLEGVVNAELATSKLTVQERERLKQLLAKIGTQLNANAAAAGKSVQAARDENAERTKAIAKATELGRKIETIASGVLQMADAWGLVDDRSAKVLRNAIEIGKNLPAALAGDKTAIFGALTSGVSLLKNAFFGGSGAGVDQSVLREQERRAKQMIDDQKRMHEERLIAEQKTRFAIEDLASRVGDLGSFNLSGRDVAGAKGFLQNALQNGLFNPLMNPTGAIASAATMADLERIASQLGIEFDALNPNMEQFRTLLEALNAIEIQQFAQTFMGQLEALRAEFELFDIRDPIAQLKKLVELFANPQFGAPALREALAGLDLNSPEGRAAAREAIQQLFLALKAGTLDPSQLGGLTGQQFLEQLLAISQMLGASGAGATSGQTGQFSVERRITEVQADRLLAIETTGLAILTEQLAEQRKMSAYLGSLVSAPVSISPPSLAALSAYGGAPGSVGGVTINGLTINVTAGPGSDPNAIASAIAGGLAAKVAVELEALNRDRGRAHGAAMTS